MKYRWAHYISTTPRYCNIGRRYYPLPHGWVVNHRSVVALAMCHRLSGISSYGLNDLGKGDELFPHLSSPIKEYCSSYWPSVDLAIFSLHLAGESSILRAINFITNICHSSQRFRTPASTSWSTEYVNNFRKSVVWNFALYITTTGFISH